MLTGGRSAPSSTGPLDEPEVHTSSEGELAVTLTAERASHRIGGRTATTLGYNGGVPGPTLRVRPGDTLKVDLVNRLEETTNLHVHGLHVSPEGNSDNVFVAVGPGETFSYEYHLPKDHPPGLYWYHPHHHGHVAEQVFGGLYGAILVEDPEPVPSTRERLLVVSDITLDGSAVAEPSFRDQMFGREGELVLVNGQVAPTLEAAPGEVERWRIVNACSSRYLSLRLDGQGLRLLGQDLERLPQPRDVETVLLAPGNRADLLVSATAGTSSLRALPYDRGSMMGAMMGGVSGAGSDEEVTLATLKVSGADATTPAEVPEQPPLRDLRSGGVDGQRLVSMEMGMGGGMMGSGQGPGMTFTMDGRAFDPQRTDQQVALGRVEEWTIRNTTPMDHPFHLHVWPMQLIEDASGPVDEATWRDVVNVPARSEVTVRVAFEDYGGRTVYHCHILDHEDRGMMAVIDVA